MLVIRTFCPRFHILAGQTRRFHVRHTRVATNYIAQRNLLAGERVHDCLHARGYLQTSLRVLDMIMNGALTQPENARRHPIALALRGQFQTLSFARAQRLLNRRRILYLRVLARGLIQIERHQLDGEIRGRLE